MAQSQENNGFVAQVLEGVKEYLTKNEDALSEIKDIIITQFREVVQKANDLIDYISGQMAENFSKELEDTKNRNLLFQLKKTEDLYHSNQIFRKTAWEKAITFEDELNKALDRRVVGSLTWPDGHINIVDQEQMKHIVSQSPDQTAYAKTKITSLMKKATSVLDKNDKILRNLQEDINHVTNIYGGIYSLMLERWENKTPNYKSLDRVKDYPQDDTNTYYWWPNKTNNKINACKSISNRGYIGEVYTSYILSKDPIAAQRATSLKFSNLLTERQNHQVEKELGESKKYSGNQDNMAGVLQGDVLAIFRGTRIQIAVKSLGKGKNDSGVSSESLRPIIGVALVFKTFKNTENLDEVAKKLANLFYGGFEKQFKSSHSHGDKIAEYAVNEINKILPDAEKLKFIFDIT